MDPETEYPEGGEAACWAHLVCPECGAIVSEGHAKGCSLADSADADRNDSASNA